MITGIQIREFKILSDIDIPIRERFTVIVGPNGSGKSTLLSAIRIATANSPPEQREHFRGSVKFEDEQLVDNYPEGIRVGWKGALSNGDSIIGSPTADDDEFSEAFRLSVTRRIRSRMLRLVAQSISKASWSESETPVVADDGSNLPSVIACYLKRKQLEIVDRITESLRMLVPQIRGIWVDNAPREKGKPFGEELKFDTVSKNGLPARVMSEGTLLATALLTLLHGEKPPNLLLMDDLDKGLHPRAISSLVEILNRILSQRPELQIFATSHSPYLLDLIPIEAVICLYVGEDGHTRAKPLTDHPEYPRWKGVMTAGEFWGTMGDEWVIRDEKAVAQ